MCRGCAFASSDRSFFGCCFRPPFPFSRLADRLSGVIGAIGKLWKIVAYPLGFFVVVVVVTELNDWRRVIFRLSSLTLSISIWEPSLNPL
jgi:hypothetical protein